MKIVTDLLPIYRSASYTKRSRGSG
uniref:Uncharacterized protein n=1 Tax=Arabidopsis thaliana TaxID=3702 RepID=Q0WNB3_ARATH|nr:hypothetical protein [Arabidopsis thaliana]